MAFVAKGQSGSLRVGGRAAASLGEWTFTAGQEGQDGGAWRVTAAVAAADPYWLDRGGPYELRLTLSKSTWRWRTVQASVDQQSATITGTGDPEDA